MADSVVPRLIVTGFVLTVAMAEDAQLDVGALERLVQRVFGDSAAVGEPRRIRPWTVARCDLVGVETVSTVIVKWLRSNPEGFRVDRRQIRTEAAALALISDLAPGVGPELFAHDATHDLVVTEDLAPRRTLHSMLSSGLTPAGLSGLHTFAATMGRLHAATAARQVDGPWDDAARVPIEPKAAADLLDRLGVLVSATRKVASDVEAAITEIAAPGLLHAFSNGDSGANNCLVAIDGTDGRLIDFEHACWRHVLLDAASLHVPGSMWMTVADPVPLGVDDTYRRVAGDALPTLQDDDLYGSGLSAACALRTLNKLMRFEKLDSREHGHHSRRQLVTTIERAAATMQRSGHLAALRGWLVDVADALRLRWPDADVEFPNDYSLREPFAPDH